MKSDPNNSLAEPRIFEIKGWYPGRCAQVAVLSRSEIATARRIIDSEVRGLAERCEALEERLLRDTGVLDKTVAKSKIHHQFDLDVTASTPSPSLDRRVLAAGMRNGTLSTPEPAVSGQSLEDWFIARFPKRELIVTSPIGAGETLIDALKRAGFKILPLVAGEGSPIFSQSGNPSRYRPQADSLAQWLVDTPLSTRAHCAAFILRSDATDNDRELIRHRLYPHQIVCTPKGAPIADLLASDWDGRIIEWPGYLMFTDPGPRYLDPVLLSSERLAEINWPKISVVTVSFNQAAFLEDCLRSVLDQEYPNLEYIVVDAVSTDGSQAILRRYESRLSKLIIEPDKGQSDGLNKGLSLATGDILTWINSDDMLAPGALRRAALAFMNYGCDLVVGGCERISENSDEILTQHHPALPFGRTVQLGFFEQFMWSTSWEKSDYFFQPEVLFTADIWRRSGGYLKLHLHWAMDWDLWIRMGLAGATIAHIPDTIGRSRVHPAQKTTMEELYLYQLKNILLEHDDALRKIEAEVNDMPDGASVMWLDLTAIEVTRRRRFMQRLWGLRRPGRMKAAILRRLPARLVDRLRRMKQSLLSLNSAAGWLRILRKIWRTRVVRRLSNAAILWLPSRFIDRMRLARIAIDDEATRALQQRYDELSAECLRLSDRATHLEQTLKRKQVASEIELAGQAQARQVLEQRCNELMAECLRLSDEAAQLKQTATKEQATTAGVLENVADLIASLLFHAKADSLTRSTVATLVAGGTPIHDVMRTVAIQKYAEQGQPQYALFRPFLSKPITLPAYNEIAGAIDRFTIVDIGAEPLSFEPHIYAALPQRWPSLIIGFDPMDERAPRSVKIGGSEGVPPSEMWSLPYFVGDGMPATFHHARMQATSSLYEPNVDLARRFSLLAEAIETVEARPVATHKLDDALNERELACGTIDFLKIDTQGGTLPVVSGAADTLSRTLVCHLEAEFSEIYRGEALFSEIDAHMRAAGFNLLDLATLGRQRYNAFDASPESFFHTGRLLWADCIYVRHLDEPNKLSDSELLKLAIIAHEVYQRYDVAAFALNLLSQRSGSALYNSYVNIRG